MTAATSTLAMHIADRMMAIREAQRLDVADYFAKLLGRLHVPESSLKWFYAQRIRALGVVVSRTSNLGIAHISAGWGLVATAEGEYAGQWFFVLKPDGGVGDILHNGEHYRPSSRKSIRSAELLEAVAANALAGSC